MAAQVEFKDFTVEVKGKLSDVTLAVLEEVAGELESQTVRNTSTQAPREMRNRWRHEIKLTDDGAEATVGNPMESAIWEELGTGSYALYGNGRKGYWVYVKGNDSKSTRVGKSYTLEEAKRAMAYLRSKGLEAYYTNGKPAHRPLYKAYTKLKSKIILRIQRALKEGLS